MIIDVYVKKLGTKYYVEMVAKDYKDNQISENRIWVFSNKRLAMAGARILAKNYDLTYRRVSKEASVEAWYRRKRRN